MAKTEQNQNQTSKKETIISVVVNTLLVLAIILAFVCTYTSYVTKKGSGVPSIFGYAPFAIQSDSMTPFFDKGDLVISKVPKDTSNLEKDQIITFWTIINGERVLNTHRISSVEDGGTYTYYVTKGDKYTQEDYMTVHQSEVVGVYVTHIKGLGSVLDFLQTSQGFLCIVVLPVFAFFIYYVVQFFRALFAYQAEKNREQYREELSGGIPKDKDGNIVLTQEQLQQVLAQALVEAGKKNASEEAPEAPKAEETKAE